MATSAHEIAGATAPRTSDGSWATFVQRVRRAIAILHRIIGAPDYDGYLAHAQACHPDRTPMTRDEFVKQRLEDRYSRPGSRCC